MHKLGCAGTPITLVADGVLPAGMPGMSAHGLRAFWESLGRTTRVCLGTMFGTRLAMIELLAAHRKALAGSARNCWDQGILNMIVWTGALAQKGIDVYISGFWYSAMLTHDNGGLRDAYGRYVNELGIEYALVHSFKAGRKIDRHSGLYDELSRMLPADRSRAWYERIFPKPLQRTPTIDNLFKDKQHDSIQRAWRNGFFPMGSEQTPMPKRGPCTPQYRFDERITSSGFDGPSVELMVAAGFNWMNASTRGRSGAAAEFDWWM